ncbi:DNA-directed RNA polymerase ii subunit rpb4 [Anaeramoeba flamelloides]|uniref:DNA-directed RNA polymerase ii subunit rpb4 n=1 Tax=Anaeramoeba flamelloides TaxID=1746091 RepID=A0AAV7Z0U5_9EUKA|nr:DNA-directed RNA polymerase ii subunit rpb4 [Anaeramoeba flamelloides]
MNFGEFVKHEPLMLNEVQSILNQIKTDQTNEKQVTNPNKEEILNKTLRYVKRFSRFQDKETISGIKVEFQELDPIELTILANLFPEDVDEAKVLIPSLAEKYSDEEITDFIERLHKYDN